MVRRRRCWRRRVTSIRPIPEGVRAAQARASDPAASAFVSANAGSGKTHVLVQRVVRLLLDGVPAHFAVREDRDQNEMMERASLKVLLQAAAAPDSMEGRALAVAMTSAADVTFRDVVREASLSRDRFLAWTDRAGSLEAAMA